ncbi:MAG: hypothetical protein ACYDEF_01610 [Methanosarcina sp.]
MGYKRKRNQVPRIRRTEKTVQGAGMVGKPEVHFFEKIEDFSV